MNGLVETTAQHLHVAAKSLSRVQLFVIPWIASNQAPLSRGFSRQEQWSGLSCPPPGDLPDLGIEFGSLISPALPGEFFTTSSTWEAQCGPNVYFLMKNI